MPMDSTSEKCTKREVYRGAAWTAEEDQRLAQAIEVHGPKRWRSVAAKAGLNRCGKSCRLRWMNYLRPNIKRGNISDQEEDLILRLHKLLGNRWSLIAGRLPGRTDNEIKNYWNSHLSKKVKQNEKKVINSTSLVRKIDSKSNKALELDTLLKGSGESTSTKDKELGFDDFIRDDQFFELSMNQEPLDLGWMSRFLELDETWFNSA